MGMPVVVDIVGGTTDIQDQIFDYFTSIDERFSTYKHDSEISKINRKEITPADYSSEMKEVLALCEETKKETMGYFDIVTPEGIIDPSGLVKGWAIRNAAHIAVTEGYSDFWVEAGGDIQTSGVNADGSAWSVGICNPFNRDEIIKVVYLQNDGIATSGTYIRRNHIYNPHAHSSSRSAIVSITVIGPDVYEADRFATPAFAMGEEGVHFIEQLPGFEAYSINEQGIATMTTGFARYTA